MILSKNPGNQLNRGKTIRKLSYICIGTMHNAKVEDRLQSFPTFSRSGFGDLL